MPSKDDSDEGKPASSGTAIERREIPTLAVRSDYIGRGRLDDLARDEFDTLAREIWRSNTRDSTS